MCRLRKPLYFLLLGSSELRVSYEHFKNQENVHVHEGLKGLGFKFKLFYNYRLQETLSTDKTNIEFHLSA